jgi:hypothetical protein
MNYTQIIAIAITVTVGLVIFPAVTDTIIAALLTAKEALETMREGLILKRKQLEQENRKGAKKNVSNSTRKRVSAHSDKARD